MFPKSVSHAPVHKKSPEKLDNSHEDSFLQSKPAIKLDSSDAKQRKASNSIFNIHLEKAPADQTDRDFFSKNLHTILNQREILSSCPFFQLHYP